MLGGVRRALGPMAGFVELVVTVAIAVGLAFLIQAFVVKPYRIPSASMEPTLSIGQRILVNRLDTKPALGDVVVFHPPHGADLEYDQAKGAQCGDHSEGPGTAEPCDTPTATESSQTFVKRIVGLPGDRLLIKDGHVYRNGKREKAPYARACSASVQQSFGSCTFTKTITVPAGEYYMMGDNRGDSDDSRYWGPVPQKWIIGAAFFTYWPVSRIGTL
jgi:signal peptidase I